MLSLKASPVSTGSSTGIGRRLMAEQAEGARGFAVFREHALYYDARRVLLPL